MMHFTLDFYAASFVKWIEVLKLKGIKKNLLVRNSVLQKVKYHKRDPGCIFDTSFEKFKEGKQEYTVQE